jgi:hypothetical protein
MHLKYIGPHDAVEVVMPDGTIRVVKRLDEYDFPPELSESLAEQKDNWKRPSPKRGKE